MKISELSVFFPAYNEEAVIKETVTRAKEVLGRYAKKWEIIVVDDGSTDGTAGIVKALAKKDERIRLVRHDVNRGYGAAVKSGLYSARYKWIVFTDSDGQFDFGELPKFLQRRHEADLVIGYRIKRRDSFLRFFIAWGLKIWNLALFGIWFKDADCAFKLVKKQVVESIPPLQSEGAMLTTEFLIRAKQAGFRFAQVGVHHYPRVAGRSTGGSFRVIWKAVRETLKLWRVFRIGPEF